MYSKTSVENYYNRLDGLIITGTHTGQAADANELSIVKEKVDLPVYIGSGVTGRVSVSYFV